MLGLLRSMVRKNPLSGNCEEDKETCAGFAVGPQTVKVMAIVYGNYLVKMEKTLNVRGWET